MIDLLTILSQIHYMLPFFFVFICFLIIHPKMKSFHLYVLSIILTTLVNQAFAVDSSYYDACKPQTCGNGPNISYPFWLSDQQESYCGYPSFKLACNDQNPVLTISDDDYIIKEIFYSNHSFLVANSAAFKDDECPLPLHKLSLDRTPFSYSSTHVDFSFFYNCSQEPVYYMHTYAISCASNSTFHSFATFHKEVVEYMNHSILDSCKSSVDVPVDNYEAASVDTLLKMGYTEILKMGFLLNWTAQNCSNCVTSGGCCGFNYNEFVCFCSDRTHDKTCDDGTSVVTFFTIK